MRMDTEAYSNQENLWFSCFWTQRIPNIQSIVITGVSWLAEAYFLGMQAAVGVILSTKHIKQVSSTST